MNRRNKIIQASEDIDLDIDEELPNEDEVESDLDSEEGTYIAEADEDALTDEEMLEQIQKLDDQKLALIERSRQAGRAPTKGRHTGRATAKQSVARAHAPQRAREVVWTEPSALEAPPPRPGMEQRWVRFQNGDKNDPRNWSRRSRGRWTPRHLDTVEGEYMPPTMNHGQHGEVIGIGDLILCERPIEVGIARTKFYRQKQQRQVAAADRKHLSRVERSDHPIKRSIKHAAPTVGTGRRVRAQED